MSLPAVIKKQKYFQLDLLTMESKAAWVVTNKIHRSIRNLSYYKYAFLAFFLVWFVASVIS